MTREFNIWYVTRKKKKKKKEHSILKKDKANGKREKGH